MAEFEVGPSQLPLVVRAEDRATSRNAVSYLRGPFLIRFKRARLRNHDKIELEKKQMDRG